MVKNAIYSYKLFDDYFKPLDDNFFNIARLSVKLSGVHYRTILYCDQLTKEAFDKEEVIFDEYRIREEWFENIDRTSSGVPKILAISEQTEPYVLLDLDTLIFVPITTQKSILYGFKEANNSLIQDIDYIKEHYIESYYRVENDIDIPLKWDIFPSNCLMVITNPLILKEAANYTLSRLEGRFSQVSAMFYEQFLIFNFLRYHNVPFEFLYEYSPVYPDLPELKIEEVIGKQFVHLGDYYKTNQKRLVKELTKIVGT